MEVWTIVKWFCILFVVGGFILPITVTMNVRAFLSTKYNAKIEYIKKLREEKIDK